MASTEETSISLSSLEQEVDKMPLPHDFTWRETSPGVYERDVDELEFFYTAFAKINEGTGKVFFAIISATSFSIPLSVTIPTLQTEKRLEVAVFKGWKKTLYDYPTLMADVKYIPATKWCKKVYTTPTDDGEVRARATLKFINGISAAEFTNNDPPIGTHANMYILNPPLEPDQLAQNRLRRDVVFLSPHDLIDGIGTLNLLNSFIKNISEAYYLGDAYPKPIVGDEFENLSPPFRVAANLPAHPTSAQLKILKDHDAVNAHTKLTTKMLTLPFNKEVLKPGRSQRVALPLTLAESTAIISKCKALGVTPTHVFHAAIGLALRDVQPPQEEESQVNYISYSLINLRSTCMTPFNTPLHAASVYHSVSLSDLVVPLIIPSSSSTSHNPTNNENNKLLLATAEFTTALTTVTTFYNSTKISGDYLSTVPALWASRSPPHPSPNHTPTPPPPQPPNQKPSVSLSSMGIIDRIVAPKHGEFSVTAEPWVVGAEYSPGIGVFLSSWRGMICVSAAFNEAWRGGEEVVGFLEGVRGVVRRGLGIGV